MKKKTKRIWKILFFLMLTILVFVGSMSFLKVNELNIMQRIRGFYMEEEQSIDVMLLGASEMYTDYSAGLAWNDFGYTSYPFAISTCPANVFPSEIREISKTQSPKLWVIEVNPFLYDSSKYLTSDTHLRRYIDNIPMSENKLQTIKELVPKEEQKTFYFPFYKYHANWANLQKCAYSFYTIKSMEMAGHSSLKGMKNVSCVAENMPLKKVENNYKTKQLEPILETELRKLLQYLKDEGIENVLFIRAPHRVTKESYNAFKRSNEIEKIIESYGFTYVNFEHSRLEIGLDEKQDFYNNEHLNVRGMKKFTYTLGKYITDNYDVKADFYSDELRAQWDDSAKMSELFCDYGDELIQKNKKMTLIESVRVMQTLHNMEEKEAE